MKSCLLFVFAISFSSMVETRAATSKSDSKIREFYQRYPRSDTNRDGVLTIAEMRNYINKWTPAGMTSKSYPPLRLALSKSPASDLNKDGVLTKSELLRYLK